MISSTECIGTLQGFGTDCGVNCCEQPVFTGGDNCSLVTLQTITIPVVGEPPVSVTITGHNGDATFDEFPEWAFFEIFDPNGTIRDPGWWEAFSILPGVDGGTCADVRIDLCCSENLGQTLRPAWGNLWVGCPTLETLSISRVEPPIGTGGIGPFAFTRGAPFCDEDNLWMTFGSIRPGDYYYPILSSPHGTYAVPPGGQYQMHITVGACPVAACCFGQVCQQLSEIECEEQGGYWLHETNTGRPTVEKCAFQGGPADEPFTCIHGSCCLGPGDIRRD